MQQSLFRARSPDFNVTDFAIRHDIHKNDLWIKGEESSGGPRLDSGLCLLVADSEQAAEHHQELDDFLSDFEEAILELRRLMVPCHIDCGLTVGGEKNFTRSFALSPQLMSKLGELGVGFVVSAYPCSE
jgi:hypothetical protein